MDIVDTPIEDSAESRESKRALHFAFLLEQYGGNEAELREVISDFLLLAQTVYSWVALCRMSTDDLISTFHLLHLDEGVDN